MKIEAKLIDHMGNDLSPIRAAIVSNGNSNLDKYVDNDLRYTPAAKSLINFLARGCTQGEWNSLVEELMEYAADDQNEIASVLNHIRHMPPHWTPFGHTAITVWVKAPIFVARQLGKHQVGFVWNEISRRYVDSLPEFYVPDVWRGKAKDKKQGSSGEITTSCVRDYSGEYTHPRFVNDDLQQEALRFYIEMITAGVAPEQARMVLPQSMMTEWFWTGNLYAFSKMFVSRTDPHTQLETQHTAQMIGDLIEPLFPISWKALTK